MSRNFDREEELSFFCELILTRDTRDFWGGSVPCLKRGGKKRKDENIVWITRALRDKFRGIVKFALCFFGSSRAIVVVLLFHATRCKEDYLGFAPKSISTNDDFHRERKTFPRADEWPVPARIIALSITDLRGGRDPSGSRGIMDCFRSIALII